MFKNPEINRYITYKSSPGFWLWPPALILLVVWMFQKISTFSFEDIYLSFYCCYAFTVFVLGLHNAGTVFEKEFRNKTWDFQRLSPIRPFPMVLGKLFGSTLYYWYIGILFLLAVHLSKMTMSPNKHHYEFLNFSVSLICAGLMGQLVAFWYSLATRSSGFVAGLITSCFLVGILWEVVLEGRPSDVNWFHYTVESWILLSLSMLFWGFWLFRASICSAWNQMQYERGLPVDWFLFLLTSGVYCMGLAEVDMQGRVMIFTVIMLSMFYICILIESGDWEKYEGMWKAIKNKNVFGFFQYTPKWCSALFLCILGATYISLSLEKEEGVFLVMMNWVLLCARDGIVFHVLFLKKAMKKSFIILFLYFLFAYKFLPDIFDVKFSSARSADPGMYHVFYPSVEGDYAGVACMLILTQCIVVYLLLRLRLKKIDEMDIENEKQERLSG